MSPMTAATINPWALPRVPLGSQLPDAPGIYFAMFKDQILYIGMTSTSFAKRWARHHRLQELSSIRGVEIACCVIHASKADLESIESSLIATLCPVLNRRRVSGFGGENVEATAPVEPFIDKMIKMSWDDIYLLTDDLEMAEAFAGCEFQWSQIEAMSKIGPDSTEWEKASTVNSWLRSAA
jgi:hypothetical protein